MRQVLSVTDLIASLGVEEKVIAKNNRDKKFEGGFSINLVQKRMLKHPTTRLQLILRKKVIYDIKPKAITNFKKKDKRKAKDNCFVCVCVKSSLG